MKFSKIMAVAALLGSVSFCDAMASNNVVAKVDGTEITRKELDDFKKIFPPQLVEAAEKKDPQKFYVTLVKQLVDLKLVIQEAKKSGLENSDEVKKSLEAMKDQLLFKAYLNQKITPATTEDKIRKKYDEERKNMPKNAKETKASHILVKDEKTANEVIKQLNDGADFGKLARQYSLDKESGQRGGDLGFFLETDFLPEISKVAFNLTPGSYSKEPIKTQYGFHILKVFERRNAKPKPFDQEKDRLKAMLIEEASTQIMKDLRSKADVTVFDDKGQPIKDAMKEDAADNK